ncbi:hypothetical protein EDC96DRAFT_491006 [Choanephora cucurbitarum]|nr:hypothetical protein EDC96DRAFT_491006 [Choanephora cucurbitarum]
MEPMSFDWLDNDNDILDSLVQLASLPNQPISPNNISHINTNNDILHYLNQQTNTQQQHNMSSASSSSFLMQGGFAPEPPMTHNLPSQQQEMSPEKVNQVMESIGRIDSAATGGAPPKLNEAEVSAVFQQPISIVQGNDNFVTFTPVLNKSGDSTTTDTNGSGHRNTKSKQTAKKVKYREPIFVTESPQSFNKKMKKYPANNTHQSSSAEENSEDEDEAMLQNTNSSSLKQMSSKERRQLRNKISARNFRVRRKEYITKLEEKVEQQEKIIQSLKEENAKLRKANQEVMNQVLDQLITPPPSSDEFQSSSPSSSSESHGSPYGPAPIQQFQFNDLYSFDLFDQHPAQPLPETSNAFYLNHAVMPDWNMHRVLSDKMVSETTEEHKKELVRDLFTNYPLLAPALMSIVIRHTLSLEYVANLMREFTESIESDNATVYGRSEDEETLRGHDDLEDLKASMNAMNINEDKVKEETQSPKEKQDELDDQAHLEIMLKSCFVSYALQRARGLSHQQAFDRYKQCVKQHPEWIEKIKKQSKKTKETKDNKKACSSKKGTKKSSGIQTLQAYCRVAGTLLRQPQRMANVGQVLKEQTQFINNKNISVIEHNFRKSINSSRPQNFRIANC